MTAECTRPPITLSIEGQWGCGKSSFMKQLKEEIDKKNDGEKETKYFTIWFNSWKYEKEDELWASFALNFMDKLSKKLSWKRLLSSRLKLFYLRYKLLLKSNFLVFVHFSWNILSFILIFSFLSLVITYVLHSLGMALPYFISEGFFQNFANFVIISAPLVGLLKYFSTEKWFIDVFRDPFCLKKLESNTNYKDRLSFREHFHADFNEIIKSYVGDSKVYVFIDDLDRCEVPKAAELMQAINLMISDNSKVYFSLAMDRKIISAGLAAKNERVIDYLGVEELEYGYDFIEKFIQLPFKVPSPKSVEFLKFLTLPNENELPTKQFYPVNKSNKSEDFTPDKKSILEMIAPDLDNNPRRIKQFINQFRFQRAIGKRTGLFSYEEDIDPKYRWNCKKLAKFVAISINWPDLISALSSDITCLEQLQEYALKPENKKQEEDKNLRIMLQQEYALKPEKENKKPEEYKNLNRWTQDEKLMRLLKYGCEEGDNTPKKAKYTLSGLDFSKLLQISTEITSSISSYDVIRNIEFVLISAGEFIMGSPADEVGRSDFEGPLHKVTIENPFYLGKYPVTQNQWIAVMGYNPSRFKGDNLPVESVSWDDIHKFITKLNEMEGADKYRLPSEAEWEYVCRAGTATKFSFGNDESKIGDYAWYENNSGGETHPVGMKYPNSWGVYDMHGNVWEWVQDSWHDSYNGAPSDGSAWEDENSFDRILRGSGWSYYANSCRSANRRRSYSGSRGDALGFRLVKML